MKQPDVVNIGIVGFGRFAQFVTQAIASLPNVAVAAVYDPHPLAAHTVLPPNSEVSPTLTDLLDRRDIHAIYIATPPDQHAPLIQAALKADKHIIVEKPLSLTPRQGRAVVNAARRRDKIVAVNFVLRASPIINALRQLITQNTLGPLRLLRLENIAGRVEPASHWFWDLSQSGGLHIEHGVHFFDAATYMLNQQPTNIAGALLVRGTQNTQAYAQLTFPGGTAASFSHAFIAHPTLERTSWLLVWDNAVATIEGWIPLHCKLTSRTQPDVAARLTSAGFTVTSDPNSVHADFTLPVDKAAAYTDTVRRTFSQAIAAMRGEGQPLADGQAGLASLRVAWQASRRHVRLDDRSE